MKPPVRTPVDPPEPTSRSVFEAVHAIEENATVETKQKFIKKHHHKLEEIDAIFARMEYSSKIQSQNINLYLELKNSGKDFIFTNSSPSLKKQILEEYKGVINLGFVSLFSKGILA